MSLLCQWNLLPQPLLYLSGYFEKHRSKNYTHLLAVSQHSKWEEWLTFFLIGIRDQSHEAPQRVRACNLYGESIIKCLQASVRLNKLIDLLI